MTGKHPNQFHPHLETLEDRRLLAAGISFSAGVVTITGTDAADTAVVVQRHGQLVVTVSGGVSATQTFKKGDVKQIVFDGGAGNDVFINHSSVRALALGGDGDDVLVGGTGKDVLIGGAGNDVLIGRAGNDRLEGDDGNDELHGGAGDDLLMGDAGDDRLVDHQGRNRVHTGPGADDVEVRREDRIFREDDDDLNDDNGIDQQPEHHHNGGDNSGGMGVPPGDNSGGHGGHSGDDSSGHH
jgi:hypothetical protein